MVDISVVIPVFNTEKYIVECVESVLANEQVEYEILCIDDGSTDSSLKLIKDLAADHGCVKFASQENRGQSAARNRGIQMASGKYLYFLDSDDKIGEAALKNLFHYLEKDNLDVLYFSGESFYETEELEEKFDNFETAYLRTGIYEGVCSGLEIMQQLRDQRDYSVSPCIQIVRRDFLLEHEILFCEGIIHEDNFFTFQIMMNAQRAKCINDVYFYRRVRESSIMTKDLTYKNLLGYYVCFLKMMDYMYSCDIKPEDEYAVDNTLRMVKFHVRRNYRAIDKEEREKFYEQLNSGDRLFFKIIILQEVESEVRFNRRIRELELVKTSFSYRAGRVVTWPLRKIKWAVLGIWRMIHG